ncbi:LOW QUALITY PROTEIN: kelch-like protein 8 [Rhipicephalus sanguineus]|uniref:LOW QUALITY PROTEIN: kelch-like protein 8 n=1 Tax=Rhipicephalus sanguineus TaxID=34632 RepID=UPI001895C079|nr:LOW QUALITY PROTEIN: kelch-like protein 8 [Rhipicephalus sanguineus]
MSNGGCVVGEAAGRVTYAAPDVAQQSFRRLRQFFDDGQLCDVQLHVGSRSWRCHRLVLACCSPYFHAMFTTPLAESQQQEVTIGDIDEVAMDKLIQFAYTGVVQLTVEGVQALLHASSVLQMEPLTRACSGFVRAHLEPSNALGVWQFAESHGLRGLARSAELFARGHFSKVATGREFLALGSQHLARLLAAADLAVESEAQVYEALMSWVRHDTTARAADLPSLLSRVRLPLLPPGYVRRRSEDEELLRNCHRCRDLLDEARDQQLWKAGLLVGTPPAPGERSRPSPQLRRYERTIFCVGGRDASGEPSSSTEFYSIADNKWLKAADMTTRRRHVGVASVDGKLYAVGGSDDKHHLASAEVFDPATNSWKLICPMNVPRRGLGLCELSGPLYAIGGMDDTTYFNTVERYDSQSDTWTMVAPMKSPRGGVAIAVLKDCIYAIGGNVGQTSLSTCEKYDPHLNKWSYVAKQTQRRAGAGAVALDGFIYVVGGFDNNLPLSSAERYDAELDRWVGVRPMSTSRGGVGVASLAGRLYAVGGHNGSKYLNSVEAYDPVLDRWEPVANIHAGRAGPGTAHCKCSTLALPALNHYDSSCDDDESSN